jgi:hypothetical protein
MIVRVERVLLELRVTRDVNLRHAFGGNAVDVLHWIEACGSARTHRYCSHRAGCRSRPMDHLVQKLPLGHLRLVKLRIAADVFDSDGNLEEVLHLANARSLSSAPPQRYTAAEADHGYSGHPRCPSRDDRRATESWCAWSVLQSLQVLAVQAAVREPKYMETPC